MSSRRYLYLDKMTIDLREKLGKIVDGPPIIVLLIVK